MDLENILYEVVDWAYLPKDRDQCLAVVNTKKTKSFSNESSDAVRDRKFVG
jgi:hypothetical protein